MDGSLFDRGIVLITNASGSSYNVEELGGLSVSNGEAIDLCDPDLASYYADFDAARRLVTESNPSKLWSDISNGKIQVTLVQPPIGA